MRRRKFLQLAGGALAWPVPALAQRGANLPLVAVIVGSTEQLVATRIAALREGLKQAGLVEGRDYLLALRVGNGDYPRLKESIKELHTSNPRVYVVIGGGFSETRQV